MDVRRFAHSVSRDYLPYITQGNMSTAAMLMQCSLDIRILHGFLPERLIVLGSAIPMPKAFDGYPNGTYKIIGQISSLWAHLRLLRSQNIMSFSPTFISTCKITSGELRLRWPIRAPCAISGAHVCRSTIYYSGHGALFLNRIHKSSVRWRLFHGS